MVKEKSESERKLLDRLMLVRNDQRYVPNAVDSDDQMPEKPKFEDHKKKQKQDHRRKRHKITQNEIEGVSNPSKWSEDSLSRECFDRSNLSSDFGNFDMTHGRMNRRELDTMKVESDLNTL